MSTRGITSLFGLIAMFVGAFGGDPLPWLILALVCFGASGFPAFVDPPQETA